MEKDLREFLIDQFSVDTIKNKVFFQEHIFLKDINGKIIAFVVSPKSLGHFGFSNLLLAYEIQKINRVYHAKEIGYIDYCISKRSESKLFDGYKHKTLINKIFVDKNYRKLHIGSNMLKVLQRRIKKLCQEKTVLYGEYFPEDDSKEFALAFYKKNGLTLKKDNDTEYVIKQIKPKKTNNDFEL